MLWAAACRGYQRKGFKYSKRHIILLMDSEASEVLLTALMFNSISLTVMLLLCLMIEVGTCVKNDAVPSAWLDGRLKTAKNMNRSIEVT